MKNVIFSNYDLSGYIEQVNEYIADNNDDGFYTEEDVMPMVYEWLEQDYEPIIAVLSDFFADLDISIHGRIERWNGVSAVALHGSFDNQYAKFIRDCDYIEIYSENGHTYISATHHDGRNFAEISLFNADSFPLFTPIDVTKYVEF